MKRIVIISLPVIALALIAGLIVIRSGGGTREGNFRIRQGSEVTKVILQKHGSRVVLKSEKGEWLLNGKEKARMAAVNFLLSTLEEMQPRSSVSEKVFDGLASTATGSPVSVKVFSGRRKIKSFVVYHFNNVNYTSVLKKNSRAKAFLVYLPGYDFDPGNVFTAETDYWRPFTIFQLMPSVIKEVKMNYPGDPVRSFDLVTENGCVKPEGSAVFDTVAVKRYLSYFINVPFESLVNGMKKEDETAITSSTPYFTLSVGTIDGRTSTLKGWKMMSAAEGKNIMDTDRLWGEVDGGRLFIMRYLDIDPLLKKRSYFMTGK